MPLQNPGVRYNFFQRPSIMIEAEPEGIAPHCPVIGSAARKKPFGITDLNS
jgi:hypothetical protein